MVVPGFDAAVLGMEIGETKSVTILPADAYGEKTEEMTVDIPRAEFGEDFTANPGEQLMIQLGDGNQIPVTITKIDENTVTLDANHLWRAKPLCLQSRWPRSAQRNPTRNYSYHQHKHHISEHATDNHTLICQISGTLR